jgi:hypothetical protein
MRHPRMFAALHTIAAVLFHVKCDRTMILQSLYNSAGCFNGETQASSRLTDYSSVYTLTGESSIRYQLPYKKTYVKEV